MSPNLAIIKLAAHAVVSLGVWKVTSDVVKANTLAVTKAQQAQVAVGSFVLSSMITDHAVNHVHGYIDRITDWYKNREETTEEIPE